MSPVNFKELSFLVYGLGLTGRSVVNFFIRNKIKNFEVWDDKNNLYKGKRSRDLNRSLKKANYIVLSPGVNLLNSKNSKKLKKFKKKIITDIDLMFLFKRNFKSIVVTGTNGKSTTSKIIAHILKKNNFKAFLVGNIGSPILNINIKKNCFLVIEASSFQLSHSKFILPDYAMILNITNDHIDWHGSMKNYKDSKFKIFKNQKSYQYSLITKKLFAEFKKRNLQGKIIIPKSKYYSRIKSKIKNSYLTLDINDENMSFVFALCNLLKINLKSFVKSLNSFRGLPHRYEIFLKKRNCVFVNDSKATTFQASKFALKNSTNTYWILGGLPKKNDKFDLKEVKKNIIKSYIIGKNTNFFKSQIHKQVNYYVAKDLKNSIIQIIKDIKKFKTKKNTILLSPASASFDQYLNFEKRGEHFKTLSKHYARKYI